MIQYIFKPKGSRIWRGRYRLTEAIKLTDVSLDTSDKQTAEKRLRALVRDAEQEAAGVSFPKLQREAAQKQLLDHLTDYTTDLTSLGRDDEYVYIVERRGRRLLNECGWQVVKDITPESFRTWRNRQSLSPKTLNEYLSTLSGLLSWMVKDKRLAVNPLESVTPVDVRGKAQRRRRGYTDGEMKRLLASAGRWRPMYLTAVLTGLRRNELASLIWGWVHLDVQRPFILVPAHVDKARREEAIWLHPEVVETLRAIRPSNTSSTDRVFPRMPQMSHHKKILLAAQIPYIDELGRQADFHALRHTFDTNLARHGVQERVRMQLMRHKTPRLTNLEYIDTSLLPAAVTMERLPGFAEVLPQLASQTPDAGGLVP